MRGLIELFGPSCYSRCPQPFRKVVGYGVVTLREVNATDEPTLKRATIIVATTNPRAVGQTTHQSKHQGVPMLI
jgi:hypothetical protein